MRLGPTEASHSSISRIVTMNLSLKMCLAVLEVYVRIPKGNIYVVVVTSSLLKLPADDRIPRTFHVKMRHSVLAIIISIGSRYAEKSMLWQRIISCFMKLSQNRKLFAHQNTDQHQM